MTQLALGPLVLVRMLVQGRLRLDQHWRAPRLCHSMTAATARALAVLTPSQALHSWLLAVPLPQQVLTVVEVGPVVQKVRELGQRPQLAGQMSAQVD